MEDKFDNMSKNQEEMKKNQEEMRNDITAVKNSIESINSTPEEAEDHISELEDKEASDGCSDLDLHDGLQGCCGLPVSSTTRDKPRPVTFEGNKQRDLNQNFLLTVQASPSNTVWKTASECSVPVRAWAG
ncbi:hypothetical protein QTO34_013032 [Cnephaeus nilssonii]|uniref:Uncharacterized protein n=1 Tax=Cnephaeus nilssonii TaxID=3371016 RepID=A0AA40HB66_CNENI|nr:hypothetical protein QTO34_013032 [Eptesicus nilssonii]